jgi:hypothetical protein
MDGWNEPSQPLEPVSEAPLEPHRDPNIIDACKRLEYCYKSKETDFVNFKATATLLSSVRSEYGQRLLDAFLEWTERRWMERSQGRASFAFRSERMRAHWEEFLSLEMAKPDSPPYGKSVH